MQYRLLFQWSTRDRYSEGRAALLILVPDRHGDADPVHDRGFGLGYLGNFDLGIISQPLVYDSFEAGLRIPNEHFYFHVF